MPFVLISVALIFAITYLRSLTFPILLINTTKHLLTFLTTTHLLKRVQSLLDLIHLGIMTSIREEKHKRRQLEKKWRRSKLEIDRQLYQEQRQFVISLMNNAKINYYSELIKESASDQKADFQNL